MLRFLQEDESTTERQRKKGIDVKTCCICRNSITTDEPELLFIGRTGDNKELCLNCEQKMDILMQSNQPGEVKEAINYLYTYSLSLDDPEVVSFLNERLEINSDTVEELEIKQARDETVHTASKRDYFSEKQSKESASGGFWVSGVRAISLIAFFGMIIGGIVLAFQSRNVGIGFFIFAGSALTAFLSVAMLMIFLDLARDVSRMTGDISEIKSILRKKN